MPVDRQRSTNRCPTGRPPGQARASLLGEAHARGRLARRRRAAPTSLPRVPLGAGASREYAGVPGPALPDSRMQPQARGALHGIPYPPLGATRSSLAAAHSCPRSAANEDVPVAPAGPIGWTGRAISPPPRGWRHPSGWFDIRTEHQASCGIQPLGAVQPGSTDSVGCDAVLVATATHRQRPPLARRFVDGPVVARTLGPRPCHHGLRGPTTSR